MRAPNAKTIEHEEPTNNTLVLLRSFKKVIQNKGRAKLLPNKRV